MAKNNFRFIKPAWRSFLFSILCLCLIPGSRGICLAGTGARDFQRLLAPKDSLLITDIESDQKLVQIRTDVLRIPASILKIFTSLVAIDILGSDYRFPTDFFLDASGNLTIKGYGDPLLISEVITQIVPQLDLPGAEIKDILLDDSFFQSPIEIPGATENSVQPYDAPNGALCVNFNTVYFRKDANGVFISAEPQTPLLSYVLPRIRHSALNRGRIILRDRNNERLLYAGHLFRYFLQKRFKVSGTIRPGRADRDDNRRILRYPSAYPLMEVIEKMLYFSNNFTANQVLLAAGARRYGPPGTLAKGLKAAEAYADETFPLSDIQLSEGSGLSRKNQLSAETMGKILKRFFPYRQVLRREGNQYYKTGTLTGIQTRAGYVRTATGKWLGFVVLLNSGRTSMPKVIRQIRQFGASHDKTAMP